MTWTRFCTEKPGVEHATFNDNMACPHCGAANPTPPTRTRQAPPLPPAVQDDVVIIDSPPRELFTPSLPIDRHTSVRARDMAIRRTHAQRTERLHAGSQAQSTRALTIANTPRPSSNVSAARKPYKFIVTVWAGMCENVNIWLYSGWRELDK